MSKKIVVILVMMAFLLQGMSLVAKDEAEKKVPKKVMKFLKKGDKAIKKQDLAKALEMFKKALELDPNVALTHMKLAGLAHQQKRVDDMLKHLEMALKIDPNNPTAVKSLSMTWFTQGRKEFQQQQFSKANDLFKKILELPGVAESQKKIYTQVHYFLGLSYFTLQKSSEAKDYFSKLIAIPNIETEAVQLYSIGNYMLGVICNQTQKLEESTQYLTKYLELNKDATNNQYVPLAMFLIGSNNYDLLDAQVSKIKKEMEAKKAKPAKIKEKITSLAKAQNNIVPHLTKAIELKPDLESAYLKLGNFYYLSQDFANAKEIYNKMIAKFPTSQDISTYKKFLDTIEKQMKKGK